MKFAKYSVVIVLLSILLGISLKKSTSVQLSHCRLVYTYELFGVQIANSTKDTWATRLLESAPFESDCIVSISSDSLIAFKMVQYKGVKYLLDLSILEEQCRLAKLSPEEKLMKIKQLLNQMEQDLTFQ